MWFFVERQINAFLWLSLITVTVFLLGKLLSVFGLWAKARPLPGPYCPSFFGHCHLISRSNLNDILCKCHKKYGGIVKLWLGPTQLLLSITDTELIKEVLLKAEDKFPLTGRTFGVVFGRPSLFTSSFDKVERRRKSLEVELGGTLLERTSLIPGEKIVNLILQRVQYVADKGGLDCETVSQHLAFSILGATLFGDEFLAWPKAIMYEDLLVKIAKDACYWASYVVTPLWKQEFWNYHHLCNKFKCLTLELIEQCRQNYKSDFMVDIDGFSDARYESCGEIISLLFHGTQTMAALIGNILIRLVMHPEIQNKIHSEIIMRQNVVQRPDNQKMNIDRMPHLLATVYESARLLPTGPLLQRCSLKHDLSLKDGIVIPAGTILIVPVQLVQMDSSNWGNEAGKFNPYRFLSRTGDRCNPDHKEPLADLVDAGHSSCFMKDLNEFEGFLPFGFGARACLGQKLAILGISSLFEALLEHYEVRLQPESESNPESLVNNHVLQLLSSSPKIIFARRIN